MHLGIEHLTVFSLLYGSVPCVLPKQSHPVGKKIIHTAHFGIACLGLMQAMALLTLRFLLHSHSVVTGK